MPSLLCGRDSDPEIAPTLLTEWPVMDAISASVQPASARRVTAVPRKSWKVISTMPAARDARCQDVRRPSLVHGRPALDVKMTGEERGMASRMAFKSWVTGTWTHFKGGAHPPGSAAFSCGRPLSSISKSGSRTVLPCAPTKAGWALIHSLGFCCLA